ncbi:MAG: sugar ABC transporter substrate-binding protein [Actinomycetota bacterium]|nr:sugar ABC transporter substrate-binding protein [Actinomycetota bacterium]
MSKRARVLVLVGLMTAAVACSESVGGAGRGVGGEITVQVSGEREETAVYRAIKSAFEDDNRDVEVQLVEIAEKDAHLARLSTAFAAGDPPDVFLVNFREYSQFVIRGAVSPIADHLETAGIDVADYYEPPIEAFTFDGALQCMPQNVSSLVVYYNTALFDAAGVKAPHDGWDWDEFRAVAERLTTDRVRGVGIEPNIIRVAPFVWSNGGEITDHPERPTRFTLNEPEARTALEFIVGLVHDGLVPTENEVAAQDLETRFAAGKLAMMLSSRRDTPSFREVAGLDFDVLPMPRADEQVGILHSDAYCIAAQSDAQDLAARFIGFATGETGQSIAALGGRTVPSMVSISRSGAFLDPTQEPAHSEVFLDAIANLRATPVLPTWPEIEDVTEEVLTKLFYEPGFTIDDAVEEIDVLTRPLFEEGSS